MPKKNLLLQINLKYRHLFSILAKKHLNENLIIRKQSDKPGL